MKKTNATILIATPNSALRTALRALVTSIPGAGEPITIAESTAIVEAAAVYSPDVILLAGLEKQTKQIPIPVLRKAAPRSRIIYLLDDVERTPVGALFADITLQQGGSAEALVAAVEKCLQVGSDGDFDVTSQALEEQDTPS